MNVQIKNINFSDLDYDVEKVLNNVIVFCSDSDTNGSNGKEFSHFTSEYDRGYLNGLCDLSMDNGSWLCDDTYLLNMYEALVKNRTFSLVGACYEIIGHYNIWATNMSWHFYANYDDENDLLTLVKVDTEID